MGSCVSRVSEVIHSRREKRKTSNDRDRVRRSEKKTCTSSDIEADTVASSASGAVDVIAEREYDDNVSSTSGEDHELLDLSEVGCFQEEATTTIRWSCGELIGAGAFGRVYMGMNLESGELMAVKQVSLQDCEASRREDHVRALENEVVVLKRLRHINIVRYLGTERTNESLNIFLEYVPGGSIHSLLVRFGSFGESVVRRYTRQILTGLHFLHKNRIVHRDIKGANILVDNTGVVKLADFGASKQIANLVTLDDNIKSIKGTPFWMAPEVIKQTGHGRQADVWSVGCTVIEMSTGKAPWSQFTNQVSVMFHIASSKSPPPIPEHLSSEAKEFLRACLQRNPRDRATSTKLLEYEWMKEANCVKQAHVSQQYKSITKIESSSSSTSHVLTNIQNQPKQSRSVGRDLLESSTDEEKVVFGLSPIMSHSTRYTNNNQTSPKSASGIQSLEIDQIECSVDSSVITEGNAVTNSEFTTLMSTPANLSKTPTSKAVDESVMILDFVREKAEGDCERLAPKNPDGSPLVLSASPKRKPAFEVEGLVNTKVTAHGIKEETGKENEFPTSQRQARMSKEEIWEEELRRELEVERQHLSMRQ